jgi:predicted ATPase
MKYSKFTIKNYKGISDVVIDFSNNRILTLVGLNESGKTTILDSIKLFYMMVKGTVPNEAQINLLRPKGIDFTGFIEISGCLVFEKDDILKMETFLKENKIRKKIIFPSEFNYIYRFEFKTHKFQKIHRNCEFTAKTHNAKSNLNKTDNELWGKLITYINQNLVPEILFYEDFIFLIPDKIEFTKGITLLDKQEPWQLVLDDILKTVNPELDSFQVYVANIWDKDNDTARNRISRMEKLLDTKITKAWNELFKKEGKEKSKRLNFKEIKLLCTPEKDELHISFKVKTDSGREFSINERSKGCKWFFSFLIFTEFRKKRTKNILFLLDEPASNLHSSAQLRILDAIGQLSDGSMVIYSTHSHHLINPSWLGGAYVVINKSITDEQLGGNITEYDRANITVEKYYNYVGTGVGITQNLYYQPILDRLDYTPSFVEPIPNITITEGKYDWYTFKYINEIVLNNIYTFNFYPGKGRDQHDDIIRLYLSWGKNFSIILDGDRPGQKSKARYLHAFDDFIKDKIYTLHDVFKSEYVTEDLFVGEDKKLVINTAFGPGSYERVKDDKQKLKSKLNFAIIQLLINKVKINLSDNTIGNFKQLFDFIEKIKHY